MAFNWNILDHWISRFTDLCRCLKAWSWSRLCGGTKSRWRWTRWMAGTTPVTARTDSTSTTPLFSSKWKQKRSSWRKCPRKKVSSGTTSVRYMRLKAGLVLTSPLLLQGSSNALRPTTPARFTVPGPERPPDPTLPCFYSRQHGETLIPLFSAHQLVVRMTFRTNRLTPQQERAGNSLRGGCWWIRHSVSGRQLPVQRGTAPHLPHHPHTQLLPLGNLHQDLLHERHRWAVVFPSICQKFTTYFGATSPATSCSAFHFCRTHSVRPGTLPNLRKNDSNVFSWSYPDSWEKPCSFYGLNFQVKVVRHNHSCDSGEAPILVNQSENHRYSSFSATLHAGLFLHRSTTQTTPSLKSMWRPRSTCSAWELRTSTPEGPIAPGATASKCFPQRVCWLMEPSVFMVLTRSILLHLQSQQGGHKLPISLSWTEEMTLSLVFIGTVFRLVQYLFLPFGF